MCIANQQRSSEVHVLRCHSYWPASVVRHPSCVDIFFLGKTDSYVYKALQVACVEEEDKDLLLKDGDGIVGQSVKLMIY